MLHDTSHVHLVNNYNLTQAGCTLTAYSTVLSLEHSGSVINCQKKLLCGVDVEGKWRKKIHYTV